MGSPVGFGAPFFAKPFLKHSSTKGKIGGKTGHVVQCTRCNSLWAIDNDGVQALAKGGLPSELIPAGMANEFRNRQAKEIEDKEAVVDSGAPPSRPSSRIEKTRE